MTQPDPKPASPAPLPTLDAATAGKVLTADLANILRKAKSGKPLTAYERRLIEEEAKATTAPTDTAEKPTAEPGQDYSVNSLSKLLGADRRTLDKSLAAAGTKPTRTVGKTKFYALADAQAALVARQHPELRRLKSQELKERIRKLKLANDEAAGRLVDIAVLAERIAPATQAARDAIYQKLVHEAPTAMAGVDVATARIIANRIAAEILTKLQDIYRRMGI